MIREVSAPLPHSRCPARGSGREPQKGDRGYGTRQEVARSQKKLVFVCFSFLCNNQCNLVFCVHNYKQGK